MLCNVVGLALCFEILNILGLTVKSAKKGVKSHEGIFQHLTCIGGLKLIVFTSEGTNCFSPALSVTRNLKYSW